MYQIWNISNAKLSRFDVGTKCHSQSTIIKFSNLIGEQQARFEYKNSLPRAGEQSGCNQMASDGFIFSCVSNVFPSFVHQNENETSCRSAFLVLVHDYC